MARTDVHREMKEMFGEVIGFIDLVPDEFIAGREGQTWRT